MPTRNIHFASGEYYHLYNRGNNREAIFFKRANYLYFLSRVHKYLSPVLGVIAYCLMPTHYHLVVRVNETSEVSKAVSKAMMQLGVSYTKAINRRFDRVGTLFQGAFRAKHVADERYLVQLSGYIHANPTKDGLVQWSDEWEFSSFHEYLGIRDGSLPSPGIVMSHFASTEEYRRFVESLPSQTSEVSETSEVLTAQTPEVLSSDLAKEEAIAQAAHELVALRRGWLHPPEDEIGVTISERMLKKRTRTNLYNALDDYRDEFKGKIRDAENWNARAKGVVELGLIEQLDHIHMLLNHAVLDAYGWPHNLLDEEILERLLALNLERVGS